MSSADLERKQLRDLDQALRTVLISHPADQVYAREDFFAAVDRITRLLQKQGKAASHAMILWDGDKIEYQFANDLDAFAIFPWAQRSGQVVLIPPKISEQGRNALVMEPSHPEP